MTRIKEGEFFSLGSVYNLDCYFCTYALKTHKVSHCPNLSFVYRKLTHLITFISPSQKISPIKQQNKKFPKITGIENQLQYQT